MSSSTSKIDTPALVEELLEMIEYKEYVRETILSALGQSARKGIQNPLHAGVSFSKHAGGNSFFYKNKSYKVPKNWFKILARVGREFVSQRWAVCLTKSMEISRSPVQGWEAGPQVAWFVIFEEGYTCLPDPTTIGTFIFQRK